MEQDPQVGSHKVSSTKHNSNPTLPKVNKKKKRSGAQRRKLKRLKDLADGKPVFIKKKANRFVYSSNIHSGATRMERDRALFQHSRNPNIGAFASFRPSSQRNDQYNERENSMHAKVSLPYSYDTYFGGPSSSCDAYFRGIENYKSTLLQTSISDYLDRSPSPSSEQYVYKKNLADLSLHQQYSSYCLSNPTFPSTTQYVEKEQFKYINSSCLPMFSSSEYLGRSPSPNRDEYGETIKCKVTDTSRLSNDYLDRSPSPSSNEYRKPDSPIYTDASALTRTRSSDYLNYSSSNTDVYSERQTPRCTDTSYQPNESNYILRSLYPNSVQCMDKVKPTCAEVSPRRHDSFDYLTRSQSQSFTEDRKRSNYAEVSSLLRPTLVDYSPRSSPNVEYYNEEKHSKYIDDYYLPGPNLSDISSLFNSNDYYRGEISRHTEPSKSDYLMDSLFSNGNQYSENGNISITDISHLPQSNTFNSFPILSPSTTQYRAKDKPRTSRAGKRSRNRGMTDAKMAVIPEDFPYNKLTKEQGSKVQMALTEAIWASKPGASMQFRKSFFSNGILFFCCANNESEKWLMEMIPKIKPSNVCNLKVVYSKDLTRKVKVWVPTQLLGTSDPLKILHLLKSQNSNLHTEDWIVINCRGAGIGIILILGIDESSLKTLKEMKFRAYLGLTELVFKVL